MLPLMQLEDSAEVQLFPLFENKADSQIQIDFGHGFFFHLSLPILHRPNYLFGFVVYH